VFVANRVVGSRFEVVEAESFERFAKSLEEQIGGLFGTQRKQINVYQLN
jgi:hypothetical protein|tara:strand:- start:1056 stop:1202 length:147 start_codon:yes stop_codon:yes gene_type:complete